MRQQKAFTLIELLVVLAIVGVLIALLIPAIQAARQQAVFEAAKKEAEASTVAIKGVITDIGTQHDPASGQDLPIYKFKADGQDGEEILANFDDDLVEKGQAQVNEIHAILEVGKHYAMSVYGKPDPYRNIHTAFHLPDTITPNPTNADHQDGPHRTGAVPPTGK